MVFLWWNGSHGRCDTSSSWILPGFGMDDVPRPKGPDALELPYYRQLGRMPLKKRFLDLVGALHADPPDGVRWWRRGCSNLIRWTTLEHVGSFVVLKCVVNNHFGNKVKTFLYKMNLIYIWIIFLNSYKQLIYTINSNELRTIYTQK